MLSPTLCRRAAQTVESTPPLTRAYTNKQEKSSYYMMDLLINFMADEHKHKIAMYQYNNHEIQHNMFCFEGRHDKDD